ncbi:putative methionyl-tRNA synthetase [Hordeum vulgare]|nr:putative methionyl-tRNA synthetase [Hordeum vulgare]
MDRNKKAMANRWSTIQMACNKWHGIVEEVAASLESDTNVEGRILWMFAMYRADNEGEDFMFLHVFSRIDSCENWREVQLALDKAKETYNPDAPAPYAAKGRLDGTKKARAARDAAPAAQRLQASIEQCITNVKSSAARREEKSDARWSALMINVAAKKRNTDLEFMMRADTSTIDEKVKAWYIVQHDLISNQDDTAHDGDRNRKSDNNRDRNDNHDDGAQPHRAHADREPDFVDDKQPCDADDKPIYAYHQRETQAP